MEILECKVYKLEIVLRCVSHNYGWPRFSRNWYFGREEVERLLVSCLVHWKHRLVIIYNGFNYSLSSLMIWRNTAVYVQRRYHVHDSASHLLKMQWSHLQHLQRSSSHLEVVIGLVLYLQVCDLFCGRGVDTENWAEAQISKYVGVGIFPLTWTYPYASSAFCHLKML